MVNNIFMTFKICYCDGLHDLPGEQAKLPLNRASTKHFTITGDCLAKYPC